MIKAFLVAGGLSVALLGAGCSLMKSQETVAVPLRTQEGEFLVVSEAYQAEPIPPGGHAVTWCSESEAKYSPELMRRRTNGELWISSEMFNGMDHEPAIRHICRGDKEVLFFETRITGGYAAPIYTGIFVTGDKKFAHPIAIPVKEPEVVLLDDEIANHPGQIWLEIEGKVYVYDESRGEIRMKLDE